MKMKQVKLGFSVLIVSALFIIACKKPTANEVPEPDTEVQTAIDASWATFAISDVEMMCSFLSENKLNSEHFYLEVPGTAKSATEGTVTGTRDTNAKEMNLAFFKTRCQDGRLREGTIFFKYGRFSPVDSVLFPLNRRDSEYGHSYGFGGLITFAEYKVDGWKIVNEGSSKATLTGLVSKVDYDPAVVKLSWRFKGDFLFIDSTNKKMTLHCDLVKTCLNSTDKKNVFYASTNHRTDSNMHWQRAKISYSGTISGTTPGDVPFTLTFTEPNPLIRDFTCYPYPISGVVITATPGVVLTRQSTFHPFKMGIGTFITQNSKGEKLYPRQIYYGNEGASVGSVTDAQCDNTGEVLIQGVTYRVNFRE
jgi:hypothetical protein